MDRCLLRLLIACALVLPACGFPRPPDVAECNAASDCRSTAAPFCVAGACSAGCGSNDDCAGRTDAPLCDVASGACVGCVDATTCPAAAPFCDAQQHACRGCERDDECASGVCIEADAVCATDSAIVAVSAVGADTGECTKSAPCATLAYALQKVSAARNVVRVIGGDLVSANTTIQIAKNVVLDAAGTRFFAPASAPLFSIATNTVAVVEGISLSGPQTGSQTTIDVAVGATLRLWNSTLNHVKLEVTGGAIDAHVLELADSTIACANGKVQLARSHLESSTVGFSNCDTTIVQNRWDPGFDGAVGADLSSGGKLVVENNVFVVPSEFSDLIQVSSLAPGSTFAYNTIVNTSGAMQSPVAITCDATLNLTSNIIAYNSPNPIAGDGCIARSTLFDTVGAADAPGNPSGDPRTFFENRSAGEFHLATGSPALGAGEPDLVATDLEGTPRPAPAGTRPDVGAYESR